jgi:hypothetical protein
MRLRMLVLPAVLLAVALPAQARAGEFSGVVVAKQPQRGTLLVAGARGVGLTVRGSFAHTLVGDRVAVQGVRLHDGTLRTSRLRVLARVRSASVRGTVVRRLARGMLVASGRSVIVIHQRGPRFASAFDRGDLQPGDVAQFRIRFDDEALIEAAPPVRVGQAATARIEGTIVSLSPFVVLTEELPLTITVPAGMKLPTGLEPGQRIELTVRVGGGNTFVLVAIDEVENENPVVQAQEVEVKGFVSSSTTAQIVVNVNGTMFAFVAPRGRTLPVLPTGTFVDVRGLRQNGTITLTRLRVEDNDGGSGSGDDDGGHSGSGGGGDEGGHSGSSGGGDDGGGHH